MVRGGMEEFEDIRALVAGPESVVDDLAKLVRRKGFRVDDAVDFEEALDCASRHSYTIAVVDMGEGDFVEQSWVELLESLGMETKLFCLVPEGLREDLRDRLVADHAVMLTKPVAAQELGKHLSLVVRESSHELHVPREKPRGRPRMRNYEE